MTGSKGHQGTSYATDDTLGRVCKNYVSDFVECFSDSYREELDHFVRVVCSGEEARPNGADAAATVLARAADRFHREGRTVWLKRETRDGEILRGGWLGTVKPGSMAEATV